MKQIKRRFSLPASTVKNFNVEIDIVINRLKNFLFLKFFYNNKFCTDNIVLTINIWIIRRLVLCGEWKELYDEIRACKKACGEAHMKTILGVGELGTLQNVYKASLVAMMAGSDFIKTSTGKEAVNATLQV